MTFNLNPLALLATLAMLAFQRRAPSSGSTPRPPPPPARPPSGGTTTLPPSIPASSPGQAPPPVPWPQVVPAGLPAFPGPGWQPDTPVGPGVAARAAQLLPVLWRAGEGTYKVEQTAGRWIAYRATRMGAKKGVVAYREKNPSAAPAPAPPTASVPVPASSPPPTVVPAGPPPIKGVRTLRLTSPRMTGSDVTMVQRVLTSRGFAAADDGSFGSGTDAAVRNFQRSQGLTPDGVVGPLTWGALFVDNTKAS